MGMSYRGGDVALHAIECSFGSRLVLMNRDKIGAMFGDSAALFFFCYHWAARATQPPCLGG